MLLRPLTLHELARLSSYLLHKLSRETLLLGRLASNETKTPFRSVAVDLFACLSMVDNLWLHFSTSSELVFEEVLGHEVLLL